MSSKKDDLGARILKYLSGKQYRPERVGRLARSLGVEQDEFTSFRDAVRELMRAGRVVLGSGSAVMLPASAPGTLVGQFRGHERGFGFVVPESSTEHGDLFIPPGATMGAISGDTVAARITRRGKGGDTTRVEGEVVEILERGQSQFVGELRREGRDWFVLPDGRMLHVPILIADVKSTRAKAGDQVVVEITEFPAGGKPARGVIVEILGRHGDPDIDTVSLIREYHFREAFTSEVLDDARRVVRQYNVKAELPHREDLRRETIITIDPDDARDFDDAISLRPIKGGGYELGVHIADVSRFVQPGQPLDEQARQRGNSIYLPQHVIPMLPEILSNGLCSLQEGEPRLCKSAFIQYDRHGKRQKARFANTLIQSAKRLTYRQATAILANEHDEPVAPTVSKLLTTMDKLARIIRKRRLADGMIVLDIPEVELVMDDEGNVTRVEPTDTSFSHTIIEMFMVEANEAVAELMTGLDVPHLRRIHPDPPADAQQKLTRFLGVLGLRVPETLDRPEMLRLLESVRGKPQSFAVNLAVLRSMAQAEYSPRCIGHFALASRHYSHFTSPIRRYPDLVLHRLLDTYFATGLKSKRHRDSVPSEDSLTQIGKHCTFTERRAEAAERELRLIKLLRYLEQHLGAEEDGIVTGVTNVGIFVQLSRYLIDGLIRFEELADDWWDIDPRGGCVVGQRTGRRIAVGDVVRVQIAAVDPAARLIDLAFLEQVSSLRPSADAGRGRGRREPQRSPTGAAHPRRRRTGGGAIGRRSEPATRSQSPAARRSGTRGRRRRR